MHSWTATAPGSMFTSASPSRKRSFVSQPRFSCTSAWITPHMAARPPYAVTPNLRKARAISRIGVLRSESLRRVAEVVERGHTVGLGPDAHRPGGLDVRVVDLDVRFSIENYFDPGAGELHAQRMPRIR